MFNANLIGVAFFNMNKAVFGAAAEKTAGAEFGNLPEWDLDDLYPGRDSKELQADVNFCEQEAKSFAADYKGKLHPDCT